ncbi:hypothetical protein Goari_027167, partial [Gossypium aridum]|nr:hypothetical protein [Gossypium aridum]
MEEYTALLHCPRLQVDKAYSRAAYAPAFWKKLMNITGMSEQWITAKIKQKGECKCIPWRNLRDLILAHPDGKKKVDVFALSIYGLMIFPRALGHVDEVVSDLFDRLDKGVMSVPAILVETFRSLNTCRRAGEGFFINAGVLIGFRCLEFGELSDMHLLGTKAIQFKIVCAGNEQARRMKRLIVGSMTTLEYGEWRSKRINDNIPELNSEGARPMEEYLQVIPSELEIIKQDVERRNLELEKKIERLVEEKVHLRLDADVQ